MPSYADVVIDEELAEVAFELGLGRARVLSVEGRTDAADRWLGGDGGPDSPIARQAPAHCGTCGFMVVLAGSLRAAFGVCANEFSTVDGRVVSVEFGCGAHSEAPAALSLSAPSGVVYDDGAIDLIENDPMVVVEPDGGEEQRVADDVDFTADIPTFDAEDAPTLEIDSAEFDSAEIDSARNRQRRNRPGVLEPTLAAVLADQRQADQAESGTGEAGP